MDLVLNNLQRLICHKIKSIVKMFKNPIFVLSAGAVEYTDCTSAEE